MRVTGRRDGIRTVTDFARARSAHQNASDLKLRAFGPEIHYRLVTYLRRDRAKITLATVIGV